jgi:hypothetical protein
VQDLAANHIADLIIVMVMGLVVQSGAVDTINVVMLTVCTKSIQCYQFRHKTTSFSLLLHYLGRIARYKRPNAITFGAIPCKISVEKEGSP